MIGQSDEKNPKPTLLKKLWWLTAIFVVIIGVGVWKFWPQTSTSTKSDDTLKTQTQSSSESEAISTEGVSFNESSLFGTMLAFNANDALKNNMKVLQDSGWSALRDNKSAYTQYQNSLKQTYLEHSGLVKETGFSPDREVATIFTWNVIEPKKGTFDWTLTDLAAKYATKANAKLSAVIQPFASWDQSGTSTAKNCQAIDFAWYDNKPGAPKDIDEYKSFLTKTVERYKDNVAVWEIGNEYDSGCGGYQDNPQGYYDLVKVTSETIKKADPKAIVTNGGALEATGQDAISIKSFWTTFFSLRGNTYIDYFNLHYNVERTPSAKLDIANFQTDLDYFNNLMQANGGKKPIYITEFGIYSGNPADQPIGNPQPASNQKALTELSQDRQAAEYLKYSVLAFANGTNKIFIDLVGPDKIIIGSSAMFDEVGKARTFLTTLKLINQKLAGFTKAEKITDGQYKFTVNSKPVYVLWSGKIPSEISDSSEVTNYKSELTNKKPSETTLDNNQPIIIE